MFDEEITLITYETGSDEIGNPVKRETRRATVLCSVRSVTRSEFYNYGIGERRPEVVATMNKCEYSGEFDCEYNGHKYSVSRTYDADRDLIELTLERQAGL